MHAIIGRYDTNSLWRDGIFLSGWSAFSHIENGDRRVLYASDSSVVEQAKRLVRALRSTVDEIVLGPEVLGQAEQFMADLRRRNPRSPATAKNGTKWYHGVQLTGESGKPTLALCYLVIALKLRQRGEREITIVLHETFGAKLAQDILKVISHRIPEMKARVVLHNDRGKITRAIGARKIRFRA